MEIWIIKDDTFINREKSGFTEKIHLVTSIPTTYSSSCTQPKMTYRSWQFQLPSSELVFLFATRCLGGNNVGPDWWNVEGFHVQVYQCASSMYANSFSHLPLVSLSLCPWSCCSETHSNSLAKVLLPCFINKKSKETSTIQSNHREQNSEKRSQQHKVQMYGSTRLWEPPRLNSVFLCHITLLLQWDHTWPSETC